MTANPALFGDKPKRDARFEVRELWTEMANLPPNHPDVRQEFLLRQLNEELNSMEIAARNLVDFPDAPWELRMALARQAADEARHAIAFRRLLEARGGSLGKYPGAELPVSDHDGHPEPDRTAGGFESQLRGIGHRCHQ